MMIPATWRTACCSLFLVIGLSACQDPPARVADTAAAPKPSGIASAPHDPGVLLLLVPDGQLLDAPSVTAWLDAASETGVRMLPVTDADFLALGPAALQYAGLVLPDQMHTVATDALLQAVRRYTQAGGHTLLTYDFGIFKLDGNQKPTYSIPRSRLSDLAGVDYGLYDALREKSTAIGKVVAMRSTLRALQVPPGKSMADVNPADTSPASAVNAGTDSMGLLATYPPRSSAPQSASDALEVYSGYLTGGLVYSSFVTQGAFNGTTLAASREAGLVAGLHTLGRGKVLFVNLPLTYLKVARTDALPMHGFLHYFATRVLNMAQLSAVPNGVAGLTLNWHLDSFAAQQPSLQLEKLGIFDDGPFSIDMTAGPDAVTTGDGKGWNLPQNPIAQNMLRRFSARGHAIGSHGGWNHDDYGLNATEANSALYLPYLQANMQVIQQTVGNPLREWLGLRSPTPDGTPAFFLPVVRSLKTAADKLLGPLVRQYSPPVGNNPTWAMDWLEQQGVVAAYFAGHTGLGPTRQYRDGRLRNPALWVFPVTPAGYYATFEEFQVNKVPQQAVEDWYRDLVDFAVSHHTTRMVYVHPNGANVWPTVLQDLLTHARAQGPSRFQWYTMPRLADFMTTRMAVQWREQRVAGGLSQFEASHPGSLSEMVWRLPKARYADLPRTDDGSVTIADGGDHWIIRAGNTHRARFSAYAR
ncbi:hypothetical protein [Polaromonas sp. YR568]|uniref:hypothetical protein n=1 Tax=Polaromonas sp. YR568 TaxID=1855301 RepID=UPI0031383B12